MTAITKTQLDAIHKTMDNMLEFYQAKSHMPVDEFLSLYWTPEEHELVRQAERLVNNEETTRKAVKVSFNVEDTDNVVTSIGAPSPCDKIGTMSFDMWVRVSPDLKNVLFPNIQRPFRYDHPKEAKDTLETCVASVLAKAYERALWDDLKNLYSRCTTHEAMRYLFPGTVTILRKVGFKSLADKIEEVKSRPASIPKLSPFNRQVLKYMNTWFATQLMLETFDNQTYETPPKSVVLTLATDVLSWKADPDDTHGYPIKFKS